MTLTSALLVLTLTSLSADGAELLQNGGLESLDHWKCLHVHCALSSIRHSGHHALLVTGRQERFHSPTQYLNVTAGQTYSASAWVRLLNAPDTGDDLQLELEFTFTDDHHAQYVQVAKRKHVTTNDGWVLLAGTFTVPSKHIKTARLYIYGPEPSTNFLLDDVSVTSPDENQSQHAAHGLNSTRAIIDAIRKSDIHVHISAASNINKNDLRIHVLQTKKSFPFGTAVREQRYNRNVAGGRYRDFIHTHFNWAVTEGTLKWPHLEPHRGEYHYEDALNCINELRKHGVKVRGHNLVWSVPGNVQDWVKALSGEELRRVVKQHIILTLNKTHGLVEHWDVNNENLHGKWYQDRLHDPDYNLELFNITHHADPHVKLFLNDYDVVVQSGKTEKYLRQALQFKAARVGLYGMGAQGHFGSGKMPDAVRVKERLDTLAQAGLPIWITELDVVASDENQRADFYEAALRTFYGHPAVEGVLMWGFWDQAHWRGRHAAIVDGDDFHINAAGRRVLDLLENQWMTDDTRVLSQTGNQYTVRGFHGDYEVRVIYKGQELTHLKKTFTLGKSDHTVTVSVHT